jgi:PhzF family phenazine biosynthesis protein
MSVRAEVHQVVTFANEPFRGNPAFVVSLPQAASDGVLCAIAAELHENVLAAMWRVEEGRTALRFYGPESPHGGAGHATLAAAHVELARRPGNDTAVFALADGTRRIAARDGDRIVVAWPVMPGVPVERRRDVGVALGRVPDETLVAPFGYVAVYGEADAVQELRPDMAAVAAFDRGAVIATAPGGGRSDIVIRVFAPKLGLPEDPVCGTAHRILTPYWAARLGCNTLHSRQLSPRGGDLYCRLEGDRVSIAGQSRTFLQGVIDLPDDG